jgi:hypothetical protein
MPLSLFSLPTYIEPSQWAVSPPFRPTRRREREIGSDIRPRSHPHRTLEAPQEPLGRGARTGQAVHRGAQDSPRPIEGEWHLMHALCRA